MPFIVHVGQDISTKFLPVVASIVGEATSVGIVGAVHVFDPGGQRLTTSRIDVPSLPV